MNTVLSILLIARGGGHSMSGTQILALYTACGIILGATLAGIVMHRFKSRTRNLILAGGFATIWLFYLVDPPSTIGVAYGYPFGVVMLFILSIGESGNK